MWLLAGGGNQHGRSLRCAMVRKVYPVCQLAVGSLTRLLTDEEWNLQLDRYGDKREMICLPPSSTARSIRHQTIMENTPQACGITSRTQYVVCAHALSGLRYPTVKHRYGQFRARQGHKERTTQTKVIVPSSPSCYCHINVSDAWVLLWRSTRCIGRSFLLALLAAACIRCGAPAVNELLG